MTTPNGRKTKVGIIGCGNISGIYCQNFYKLRNVELVGVADLDPARAKAKVEDIKAKYNTDWKLTGEPKLPVAYNSVKELLASDVEMVVNLTIPQAHAEVAIQCLEAGKHTYHEKPFGLNREEGKKILSVAKAKKLRVGCAPDTFLGGGIQTCRKLIDDGWIGKPIAATAFFLCPGHESWHPDPEFYYAVGGGPMFDMGPYYLTALVNLMGSVKKVSGFARMTYPTRTITSAKKYGKTVKVETPTHVASTLQFSSGAIGTIVTSFDVYGANLPQIEVYGTLGSIAVPNPNIFGGEVKVKIGRNEWAPIPLTHGYKENSRGLGPADMAAAIAKGRPHRASGDLAFHVLDIMQAALETAEQGKTVELTSTTDRPAALPVGLRDGEVD
ncbi:MAG: Gfo/Idh/MocA family oxidoreductase [Phycisphaerales bacterium]|nr:Gfo/Idh/MocA family oxidoreductase [Phycisphaerales bacterium]